MFILGILFLHIKVELQVQTMFLFEMLSLMLVVSFRRRTLISFSRLPNSTLNTCIASFFPEEYDDFDKVLKTIDVNEYIFGRPPL